MAPYSKILKHLRDGKVIPFLGSEAVALGRGAGEVWTSPEDAFLPRDPELASYLGRESGFAAPDQEELTWVAHCYSKLLGRDDLEAELEAIYTRSYPPRPLHKLLARFPNLFIVTLCWDHLLEAAFKATGRPFHRVACRPGAPAALVWQHGAEPEEVPANEVDLEWGRGIPVILKLYGGFDVNGSNRRAVVTEGDHVDFLAHLGGSKSIPACFAEPLQTCHRLLLGCRLGDWSLRMAFDQLRRKWPRKVHGWAVHLPLGRLETELWEREHNLTILDMPLAEFVDELSRLEKEF